MYAVQYNIRKIQYKCIVIINDILLYFMYVYKQNNAIQYNTIQHKKILCMNKNNKKQYNTIVCMYICTWI